MLRRGTQKQVHKNECAFISIYKKSMDIGIDYTDTNFELLFSTQT